VGSTFTADSDGDYTPQQPGSLRPWLASGNIAGITAVAAGRNLEDSSAIVESTFEAANIGNIYADVQTVEGGNAIFGSTFTARTAVYDGRGNFDNTGTIGDVLVRNRSSAQLGLGTGIENTAFLAGSAGSIGDITVTTSGASGILASSFFANVVDFDQNAYTSTIGDITVNTGRALAWTIVPVAITGSSFIAAAGIGDVTVDSIGSGITASTFVADFDYLSLTNVPGVLAPVSRSTKVRAVIGVPSPPPVRLAVKRSACASTRTFASVVWGKRQSRTSRRETGCPFTVSSSGSVTSRVHRPSTTKA
jgi:hypothetical protein